MAWTAPTTRQTGDLITADIWNTDVVDNLQVLHDANFVEAYDSGWFAVTYGAAYAKTHGLGAAPRHAILLWASTAQPTDWHVVTAVTHSDLTRGASLHLGATTVTATTGNNANHGVLLTPAVLANAGYYRILAWR